MSSSTSTFTFTTFTSNHTTDGLPSYSEVFPSAPLLNEFSSSIFGTAAQLNFQFDCADSVGYSFLIRDTFGCLQAKGEVADLNIRLQSVHGTEMFKITETSTNNVNNTIVHTFDVRNKNLKIGSVKVAEKGPASTCLQIMNKNAHPEIIVRSLKLGDFSIYRGNALSNPISNIQMPYPDIHNRTEFHGTIIFHPDTGITSNEQLLCTAAAIAFKVVMKQVAKVENAEAKFLGYGLGIIVVIIIIVAFVILFNYMEKRLCERRKEAGFSSYTNREC